MRLIPAALLAIAGVATAQANEGAALQDFERIVNTCKSRFTAEVPVVVPHPKKPATWVKRANLAAEISYDVKRTDSLVSPLTASLVARYMALSEIASTQEEAEAIRLNPAGTAFLREEVIRFAYQNGAWSTVGATSTSKFRPREGGRFEDSTVLQSNRQQALEMRGPIQSCMV